MPLEHRTPSNVPSVAQAVGRHPEVEGIVLADEGEAANGPDASHY